MTRWQQRAYRLRHVLLVLALVSLLIGFAWLVMPYFNDTLVSGSDFFFAGLFGTPLTLGKLAEQGELSYGINIAVVVGLLLAAHWAFLRPGRRWTVRLSATGRPLKSAVFAAAFMAMLLTTGMIALLLELPGWWQTIMGGMDDVYGWSRGWGLAVIWAVMLVVWGLWAWVFFIYWRQGDRYTQLGKMVRALIVGSLLEAFVAVPVHVWATRQRECYCCRGTYTTLVLAGTVLLWAFGPGIILLYMREKHRRAALFAVCAKCGYDLRGNPDAKTCPECGADL